MSWLRVEGSSRDPELTAGLAARIADPLWTLTRQWQVGEFHGEDASSPILVNAQVVHTPLTAFAPGLAGDKASAADRADADRPLEVLVEQESAEDDLRLTLEQGWILLRAFTQSGAPKGMLDALRKRFPVAVADDDGLDPLGRGQLEILVRRSLDGRRLAAQLTSGPQAISDLLDQLGVPPDRRGAVTKLFGAWLEGAQDLVREPRTQPCWRNGPLEYQFRVAAPLREGELGLDASEYRGGTLDWYHFRRTPRASALSAAGQPRRKNITVLPAPLRFNGMPAPRFWTIEDDSVSFGDLAAAPEDLVRSVVGAFSAVYNNDWLSVPCVLPAGTLARVESLTVFDDYGDKHEIHSAAALDGPGRVWRFFEIEGDDGPDARDKTARRAPLMLLAPALADVEEGPALERVDFLRDQAANLGWAIERKALGASGRPLDRDAHSGKLEPPDSEQEWSYRAYSLVKANWIPFTPVRLEQGAAAQTHLRRSRMALPPPGLSLEELLPLGKILDASAPLRVHEEAIPDAGLRVDRRYQRTRDANGRIHLWIGRRVRLGAWPARGGFVPDRLVREPVAD
ncbi:MAG: hypothetical protein H6509_00725 [Bryobacterales bacterium]|nr:hypothetical protein [Acidobacteriota bacterium]MCB9383107.1 hypothetical protein [Bryobacterales bacterium]